MKRKNNIFAAVLSLLLIFTFVPVRTAFAAEAEAELYLLEVEVFQIMAFASGLTANWRSRQRGE